MSAFNRPPSIPDNKLKPFKGTLRTGEKIRNILNQGKKENPKPKNAVCDCCGNPGRKTHGKKSSDGIVLDHCHDTGTFRGWLCQKCNRGLGCFGDSIQGLELGIKYLNKVKEKC